MQTLPKDPGGGAAARGGATTVSAEAMRIHRSALVFDGHNDLAWKVREDGGSSFDRMDLARPQPTLHTDIPRLKTGGLGAQFWSAYVPTETMKTGGAVRMTLEQIDLIHRMVRRYPDVFEMADTADDVERIRRGGKIACMIGVEGGHSIENSLAVLRVFHRLGVRYMTLTHSDTLEWADSATDEAKHGGLTEFGEQVVREMNRIGMLVDISHVSAETMHDVLRITKAPVIASHSSAFALAEHPRNVPDDVLREVAKNRGVVMVNFYPGFIEPEAARQSLRMFDAMREARAKYSNDADLRKAAAEWRRDNPMPRGTVATVADHIDHVVKVAGIDCVGLGSDYDGISTVPEGLEDVSCYPHITQELLNRGYGADDIRKVLGGNALRALREAERVAREWRE